MILLLDNYDSFTYNIAQYIGQLGVKYDVIRNDQITVDQVRDRGYSAVVISPGPCTPREAGISVPLIEQLAPEKLPILGVCLGHQSIGAAFGAEIVRAPQIVHGKVSPIFHDNNGIYRGLANPFDATRYHSLIIRRNSLPDDLHISSQTKDGLIMGVRHKSLPVEGVQFHPESILTNSGMKMLKNFFDTHLK
jgi:anthranilate synthase/aminodeoxychorismate synthase-like glutamine amidotransferase